MERWDRPWNCVENFYYPVWLAMFLVLFVLTGTAMESEEPVCGQRADEGVGCNWRWILASGSVILLRRAPWGRGSPGCGVHVPVS